MVYPDLTRSLDPATLCLAGLTPLLAVCTTLVSGLAMSLAYLVVLCLTGVTVSVTTRFIPGRIRVIYLLLLSAAWVSIIDVLMQAGCYALREQLGIYLYLLAMNTTLLFHLETSPLRQTFRENIPAAPVTALTGAALLSATGLLRELAARGGILTDVHLLARVEWLEFLHAAYLVKGGLHLFDTSAGAFITYGLLLAVLSYCFPRMAGRRLADH